SQGQTIPYIIIDIVRPPTGGRLTLFNVYVALLRSSGQEDERLQELNLKTEEWWKGICREEIDINVYTDR
ncbi:hypothetical protein K439DRAFT_1365332, partial [Ramaria rubella]